MITWKIWELSAGVPGVRDRTTNRVFEVVIETGEYRCPWLCFLLVASANLTNELPAAFYCAHLFILIVSISVGSNMFFVFLDPVCPFHLRDIAGQANREVHSYHQ